MSFEVAHFHDKDILCEYRDAFTADDELYWNIWKLCVWQGIVSRLWQQIPGAYLIWMIRHTAEVYLFTHKELSLVKGGTEKGKRTAFAFICSSSYFVSQSEIWRMKWKFCLSFLGLRNDKIEAGYLLMSPSWHLKTWNSWEESNSEKRKWKSEEDYMFADAPLPWSGTVNDANQWLLLNWSIEKCL